MNGPVHLYRTVLIVIKTEHGRLMDKDIERRTLMDKEFEHGTLVGKHSVT